MEIPLQKDTNFIHVEIFDGVITSKSDSSKIYYEPRLPNLHILGIAPTYLDLKYNIKDVNDFSNLMKQQEGKGIFNKVFVEKLVTKDSTTGQFIRQTFEKLSKRFETIEEGQNSIAENDVLIVFFSSHGKKIKHRFKLIPSDYNEEFDITSSVDYKTDILSFLNEINCKKIVFADACHSGSAKSKSISSLGTSELLNNLNENAPGILTISSCKKDELSYEDKDWKNGAFTEAVLEALSNKKVTLTDGSDLVANQEEKDKEINALSLKELFDYLAIRVPDLIQEKFGKGFKQTPTMPQKELDNTIDLFILNK